MSSRMGSCFPQTRAVSMDRCNTCLEFTGRSFKAQSFSWTLIEAQRYLVEIGLRITDQLSRHSISASSTIEVTDNPVSRNYRNHLSEKPSLRPCANFRVPPTREHLNGHSAVSRNGLPYRCLSFEDRSSSDKTLPRYSVRAFLYSAMIRGFSFGPASA